MRLWSATAALALAALMFTSCSEAEPLRVEFGPTRVERHGALVRFSSNRPLSRVQVLSSGGELLVSLPIPRLSDGELLIPLEGASGDIELVASSPSGDTFSSDLSVEIGGGIGISLSAPFASDGRLVVTAGDRDSSLFLSLSGRFGEPLEYEVEIIAGDGIRLQTDNGGEIDGGKLRFSGGVQAFVRPLRRVIALDVDRHVSGRRKITARAAVRSGGVEREYSSAVEVIVHSPGRLKSAVSLGSIVMPASADGGPIRGRRRDFIALSGGWGMGAASDPRLLANQAITLRNSLGVEVPVIVSSEILSAAGAAAAGFASPPNQPGPASKVATLLPARGEAVVTLPVYAAPGAVQPGRYSRRVEVRLAGNGMLIDRRLLPLDVERPAEFAMAVTAVSVAAAVLLLLYVFARGAGLLAGFTTRQIVLIALVAAASVVLVNLPVFFLANITLSLMGPLGLLVDALLSEFLYSALLVALIAVIPRQGVCTMVAGVRFLLGGLLLGMLTPVGLLHTAVSALTLEAAVWFSGVTRRPVDSLGLRLLISFAAANALISWVGFQLAIVLFRLNYAGWYIALSVFLGGFLYSLAGAAAGRRIGRRLAQLTA